MAEPLKPEELVRICNPEELGFTTTEEVPTLHDVIGQERAMRALDFGLGLPEQGYNIYVLGESGTGRTSIVKARLEEKAKEEKVPDDWCYVYNFHDPDRPRAINLPPGKGSAIRDDMDELIEALKRNIPRVFESKDYERHRDEILEGQQERTRALFQRLEKLATERGFLLKKTPAGLAVVPAGKDGRPLSQKEYEELPREKKHEIDENTRFLQEKLNDAVREARNIEKETKERIDALDREVVQYVVNPLINELIEKYREFENLVSYLEEVREDILRNIDAFRPKEEFTPFGIKLPRVEPSFERYKINLIVNNKDTKGAPVVVETNPTYYNLFGKIEYRFQYGVAVTD
ncbi:MAG TPA: ATP-dependent protease, partial [Deltaproteobacteria bacterium]|nr:ATP-dependent protease [Deltaproteobacteria bacterium]